MIPMKSSNQKYKYLYAIFILFSIGTIIFSLYGFDFYSTEMTKSQGYDTIDILSLRYQPIQYDFWWIIMNGCFVLGIIPLGLMVDLPSFTDIYIHIRHYIKHNQ